jgi:hypothetical protein
MMTPCVNKPFDDPAWRAPGAQDFLRQSQHQYASALRIALAPCAHGGVLPTLRLAVASVQIVWPLCEIAEFVPLRELVQQVP